MEYLMFLIGVIVGCLVTQYLWYRKSAYGYFVLEPVKDPDDPDLYTVGIKILDPIEDKNRIILTKKKSQ